MGEVHGEYPTVIGPDAKFKGELTFEKGVRIDGVFDGNIRSKGTLHVAEGARVSAAIEAGNMKVEGECKGNVVVSEKLQLLATARMEGELRTTRLEIADGAIFNGSVNVGQTATEMPGRRPVPAEMSMPHVAPVDHVRSAPVGPAVAPRPRPQEIRVPANP